ncbi:MAG: sulfite exporter TauE/SafE family protein [bacterium]
MQIIGLLLTGLAAGVMSGLLGIGGATIVVPALVYFYGLSQHMSQGTTLAMMIPPIGFLAAMHYWKNGNVNVSWALILALGFFFGGLIGAHFAHAIPDIMLRRIFGVFMLTIALKLIFWG